jgi:exopolysaccharide biosynthesis protein
MKKTTAALLAAALILLSFSACGGDAPESTTESAAATAEPTGPATEKPEEGLKLDAEYLVVRPDSTTNAVITALSELRAAIKEKYGLDLTPKTDWLNVRGGETAPAKEIILGNADRDESREMSGKIEGKYAYSIGVSGTKLVICGGSDQATLAAVRYLVSALPDSPEFPSDYYYEGEIPVSERTVYLADEDESAHKVTELYPGVTSTFYSLKSTSEFGLQKFTVVEFDPKQPDLYFRVTCGGDYAAKLVTVKSTLEKYNSENTEGLKTIAAVNGDLWMVSYAHARVEGGTTTYKDYSDYVVTKPLSVPRGFNMYDGEIITSAHMTQETPYEGAFYSFGITDDGEARLGNPQVKVTIKDVEKNLSTTADGVNRLPANNALVVYTDVYAKSNYSLSDAREIVIDFDADYKFCHGASLSGKVTAVTEPGGQKYDMVPNRIILTARGSRLNSLEGFAVGDTVTIDVKITDSMRHDDFWQRVQNAVGGHIPVIIDGKSQGVSNNTEYPMTVLGIRENGNVVMLTNDGRQDDWSKGIKIGMLDKLCRGLGIVTAFILDGGGSAEMVNLIDGEYKTVNKPSDGSSRSVVNTVILACGPEKDAVTSK